MLTIGERLKLLRCQKGTTQKEIAQAVAVNPVSVQRFEYGTVRPSLDKLIALADYFDVPLDYLTGRGIFSNWERIMEQKKNLFDQLDQDLPKMKVWSLRTADEKTLMRVLPAFIDHVDFDDEKKQMTMFYYIK